jgi:hypothetical protein
MAPVFRRAERPSIAPGLSLADMDLVTTCRAFLALGHPATRSASNCRAVCRESWGARRRWADRSTLAQRQQRLDHFISPPKATGGRMVLSTLNRLKKRGGNSAAPPSCAAGGLSAALLCRPWSHAGTKTAWQRRAPRLSRTVPPRRRAGRLTYDVVLARR